MSTETEQCRCHEHPDVAPGLRGAHELDEGTREWARAWADETRREHERARGGDDQ